jgi:hypothetical protein
MTISRIALLLAAFTAGPASAADLATVDRTIAKEPRYRSKSPRYALLVFGPEAKERVWLIHDGDSLYVDRNGNGDLTEPDEKVDAKQAKNRDPDAPHYQFGAGDLRIGGRLHKGLSVDAVPMSQYADVVKNQPNAKAALAADPRALAYSVSLDVEKPGFKGMGVGGRVIYMAGPRDASGTLIFAATPAQAPVIHIDGPLQITSEDDKPTLHLGRENDLTLIVGTPGHGPGTFAMLAYEETIPARAVAKLECVWPGEPKGGPPARQLFELKERC